MEWAWPVEVIADMPQTEFSRSRFHIAFDFQDKMPGELERIYTEMEKNNMKHQAWAIVNEEMKDPDSPLNQKLNEYMQLAEAAEERGDYEEAQRYYLKASTAGKSAFRQAENYLKSTIQQRENLEKQNELAEKYFNEGNTEKAEEIWNNIKEEAKPKPLVIEVL